MQLGSIVKLNVWQDDIETDISLNIDDKSYWDHDDPLHHSMLEAFDEAEKLGLIEPVDSKRGYGIYIISNKKE